MNSSHRIRAMAGLLALLLPIAALAFDGTPASISQTEGGSRVVPMAAGANHACALQADGSAVCWGQNDSGQANVPQDTAFIALTAGANHTCGLQVDGNAICWGGNGSGQTDVPANTTFAALAAGEFHTCGLKADSSAVCWGYNNDGQASVPAAITFRSLTASSQHTCGLKEDGSAMCWGSGDFGATAVPQNTVFTALTTGGYHSCGLRVDGSVICWGNNDYQQLAVPTNTTFTGLAAGWVHTCGLKADGSAICWGYGDDGRTDVPANTAFTALAPAGSGTCGLKAEGSVTCWGPTFSSDEAAVPVSLQQPRSTAFGQIAAGNAHACELKRDGAIACWGNNDEGQATAPAGQFTQVVAGDSYSCAIGTDSKMTCWGRNGAANTAGLASGSWLQLAPGPNGAICALASNRTQVTCLRGGTGSGTSGIVRQITHNLDWASAGNAPVSCFVKANGGGYCAVSSFDAAHANDFAGPWQRLESGLTHQCGLKANGSIECWGNNDEGQTSNVPTGVIRAFSVGWNHACAIRGNGQLACWGSNLNGQTNAPAGEYIQVAAGNTFTCAIRSDGVRVCWGDDAQGQAPQLALSPGSIADGEVGAAHAGASFALSDAGPNADGDYVPPSPVFYADPADLPPGLSLSAAGVLSGTPTTGGTFTFTVEGEDGNGFTASREYTITVIGDNTGPQINYTLTAGLPGNNGWYVGNVTITWSVVDTESAISSSTGCDPATLNTDTAGATFTCTATSAGGTSSVTTSTLKRDATPPTITAAATTAPNANGWYSSDVTIHFTCSDVTSGVASCPADVVMTASGSSATPTIYDNAGNGATSNAVTVQVDKSAPAVGHAFAPPAPDGNNGWYRGNVGIDWTIGDAESGIASSTGCADATLSSDTAGASWSCTATNGAGLQTSVTTATIKRDGTAPTLAPTVPSPILRGQSYVATPNAADALSGVASQSCGALDTSSLGNKSTSCTATDNAGNSRTVTLAYTVTTTCSNDGYKGTQLTWCRNICENGLTGATLDTWIHRWVSKYRDLPYCQVTPQPQPN